MSSPIRGKVSNSLPLLVLFLISATLAAAERSVKVAPFGIDQRPMPSGADLERLVPLKVGTFQRPPFPRGMKPPTNEDLNVDYTSGKDKVNFGFSMADRPSDAWEAIKLTREEATAGSASLKGERFSLQTEPSFFYAGDFMSWSRGRYFFYAKANSPAALERFLRAFPY
jgi:hypothetical protein